MNLLFDLDGTLTDPRDGIIRSIRYAIETLAHRRPDLDLPYDEFTDAQLTEYIGPPLQESFLEMLRTEDTELASTALDIYRERYSEVGKFENRVYESIESVLGTLRDRTVRLYVATSKPTFYATQIVEHFRLAPYFEAIHGSGLDGTRVKKEELIAHLLSSESLDREDSWMIGDRRQDIRGAEANGLRSIGVLWGYGSREELEEAGATTIVSEPEAILSVCFPVAGNG